MMRCIENSGLWIAFFYLPQSRAIAPLSSVKRSIALDSFFSTKGSRHFGINQKVRDPLIPLSQIRDLAPLALVKKGSRFLAI